MRSKRIAIVLGILISGAAVAVALTALGPEVERKPEPPPPPAVRVQEATPERVKVWVDSQGETRPRTRSQLVAQIGARIVRVSPNFAEGAFFERGDPMVWLDESDFRLALQQAEVSVAEARVALEQELAQAQVAREEWKQLGRGEPNALVLRKPQLAQARAALAAARAVVSQARLALQRTTVSAPYAGRVRSIAADVGQYVAAGGPLAEIYATDYAEVRLPIEEREFRFLSIGPGYPGKERGGPRVVLRNQTITANGEADRWEGVIVRVGGTVDPRTRLVDVYARVADPFNRRRIPDRAPLPMGAFVQARIEGIEFENAFVVPRSAVRDGQLLIANGGKIAYREVGVLRTRGEEAVVGQGLHAGDLVVITAMETPVEGMTVRTVPDGQQTRLGASE